MTVPGWRPRHNPWVIALTVTLATFMEVLDTSIANVALPHVAGSLSASRDESTWVLTSYLVTNAIILPLSAWLASRFGRKRFYMACVAIFTLSSALCGMAPNLATLVLCRIVQGLGGGGLQPTEQAILADTFEPRQRGMAFAVYGIAVVCAPTLGPTLGGWITDNYSWRWLFYINVPVGIVSLILTSIFVEDPPQVPGEKPSGRVDWIGLGLVAVGLGALQVVLDKGQREDWFESRLIVFFTITAVTALVTAVIWELRHPEPIVDLSLLRERNFGASFLLMLAVGFALMGGTVLIPLFLQTVLGYTAMDAGLALSLGALSVLFLMPVVGFLVSRVQPRFMIAFGLVMGGIGTYRMTHWSLDVDFWTVATDRIVQASGLAFLFVPINTVAYAFLPPGKNNSASGLINLARNVGGSVGIAVASTLLERGMQVHQTYLVAHATPYDPPFRHAIAGIAANVAGGAERAYAIVSFQILRQATMLSVLDDLRILSLAFFLVIPLVFVLKRYKPGPGPIAAH